jgi:hypothetical protein
VLDGVDPTSYDGRVEAGAAVDVALGGSISRFLVLYGEVLAIDTIGLMQAHYGAAGIGPGVAVWLPHGTYVSASAMKIWMSESRWIPNHTGSSEREWVAIGTGYGSSFAIGKDLGSTRWSNDVRKSVALHGFIGRLSCTSACVESGDMKPTPWTTRGAMLSASITFH